MPKYAAVMLSGLAFLWRRPMRRTRFIAITGSVGKTTTTAAQPQPKQSGIPKSSVVLPTAAKP
jgi:UDP-N-acetylmuramoylalanine-D-glutamate ligase